MTGGDPFRRRRAIEMRTPRENDFYPHTPLGNGPEFDAIRRMLERWGPRARRVGDDAGVITTLGDRALVASTDTSIENVHFRAGWLSPQEIGYRATAAALSDLAAMGAKPIGILIALGVPEAWRAHLDSLTDGIGDAAAAAAAPIIGGDMSRSRELSLTITVLGGAREVLFRTGARPGDSVYVTGRLGGPLKAIRELEAGREPDESDRQRFAHPVPRVDEAQWLAEAGATAAIDISDGLGSDLNHLAAASRVSLRVDLDTIPAVEGLSRSEAAASGEEYELIVTSPRPLDSAKFQKKYGIELTKIGTVEEGPARVLMFDNGEPVPVPQGYSHFSNS